MLAQRVLNEESERSQSTCSSESTDQTLLDMFDETSLSTETSDSAMGSGVKSPESIEAQDLRVMMLQLSVDERERHLNYFVQSLEEKDESLEKIAKILSRAKCRLSDVICLRNVELTRAFLKEKDSMSDDNLDSDLVPPESVESPSENMRLKESFDKESDLAVDDDSQTCIDQVMTKLDIQNAEVILKYGPDKDSRIKHFFNKLVSMSTEHQNWKVFVEKIIKWNILNDDASKLIEQEVFQKASKEIIEMYMECEIDARIEKDFQRNALTALFGNPNVNIGFLEKLQFHTIHARGNKDFTALHYAVQNSLTDKVKFLLECGAEPNSRNWKDETPLILTLREPQVNSFDNKNIAEFLLQYGADPFLVSQEGKSFDSCIKLNLTSSEDNSKFMTELALAYFRIYKSAGSVNLSDENAKALNDINTLIKQNDYLFNFYTSCKQQLNLLKANEIRKDLTMFTIISTTGHNFFQFIDEQDRRTITSFIDKYSKEKTLHPYYINALNEHMRQYRKMLTCQNRAALAVSEHSRQPVTFRQILERVPSYFTVKDLLTFQ